MKKQGIVMAGRKAKPQKKKGSAGDSGRFKKAKEAAERAVD